MKKTKSLAAMGAQVQLGGHNGCFIADILDDGGTHVVVRTEPANGDERGSAHPSRLHREPFQFSKPTHILLDFPEKPLLWDDRRGVFVVRREQLRKVERP